VTETAAPGPIGDEAAKLVDAVQDWVRRTLGDGSHIATGAPECTWCPICQLVAVLRGDRPDIAEKITEASASVIAALRAVVDAAAGAPAHRAPNAARVQRIDLGEGEA
jgi:hypothetical protein